MDEHINCYLKMGHSILANSFIIVYSLILNEVKCVVTRMISYAVRMLCGQTFHGAEKLFAHVVRGASEMESEKPSMCRNFFGWGRGAARKQ